ncbi:magnesium and cobalt transport protein CorA [Streptomyces sp. NPDC007162]|uniref:magnesium and cobalt transport protein CorA n=1 Tax=Streptomyces sp. NPDC007162 TaxID=3156917 RepID=UPI0033CCEDB4
MECEIYQKRTGACERIDCDQADAGCTATTDRLAALAPDEFAWIRVTDPSQEELERLGKHLNLHPLAVEDAIQAHQRPKQERYGEVLAVAVKTLWFVERTADVETGEVMIFLGPSLALTVRHGASDPAADAARRLAEEPGMARLGPDGVLHAVVDVVVDAYAEAAAQVRSDLTERIYSLKREVVEFRDVADHLTRTGTEVHALDDVLGSVLDAHLATVSTWQNDDMRRISAWAAIFAVPTLVAGIYGMNFAHMPELDWRYGYPCALAVMALGAGRLYRAFRRNGWL